MFEHNLGIDGKPMVYLDLTHIDRKILDRKLEGILEIYEKFVGDDPRDTPMKIFPCIEKSIPAVLGFIGLIKSKALAQWISDKLD